MKIDELLAHVERQTGKHLAEKLFAKGETIFRRGDAPHFMFYILSGEAQLLRRSPAGHEVIFQRARSGFLAEASLEQLAYHCDGMASEQTRAVAVPISQFREALSNDDIRRLWLSHLSHELRRARAHGERLGLRSAQDRIVHFIESEGSSGKFALSQSKKSWAAEMGLTHEALYRALAAMKKSGLAEVSATSIQLRQDNKR